MQGLRGAGIKSHQKDHKRPCLMGSLMPCKLPCTVTCLLCQLMRACQGQGVLRVSQEPPGPPPAAQPRVADRSHSHIMPAPAHLRWLGTNQRSSARQTVPRRSRPPRGGCLTEFHLAEQETLQDHVALRSEGKPTCKPQKCRIGIMQCQHA